MPTETLLLHVASAWPLPGLGLLVLPTGPTPSLMEVPLHTALAVEAALPDGTRHQAVGTVDEITRSGDDASPTRGLLLDLGSTHDLPIGTTLWLATRA